MGYKKVEIYQHIIAAIIYIVGTGTFTIKFYLASHLPSSAPILGPRLLEFLQEVFRETMNAKHLEAVDELHCQEQPSDVNIAQMFCMYMAP